jgi:hypothetical protein
LKIRVRPLRMKDETLDKLYGNYVKAGFGNYVTPFVEGYFTNKRNEQKLYGAHVNFIDSKNGPVDSKNSGSGVFEAQVFGKYFGKKVTTSGEVGYDRTNYNFYGYPLNQEPQGDTLKQNFSNFHLQGYLENTDKSSKIQYLTGFKFDYLKDNYSAEESEFQIDLKTQYKIGEYGAIDVNSDLDIISQKDALLEVKTRNIFRVNPTLTFNYEGFLIKAGFNTVYENDTLGDSDEIHFFPDIRAQYRLTTGFNVYAGIGGDVEKQTLHQLVAENPFLAPNMRAFNAYNTFMFYGGIEGSINSKMGFNAGLSLSNYKNMHFFLNSPDDQSKFEVLYDVGNTAVLNVFGELSYNQNDMLRFVMRGDYWGYNTDQLDQAWHKPNYKISAISTYRLFDKLRFEAEAITLGGIKAYDFTSNTEVTLKAAFDLNLTTEYLFSKQFSAFVRLNNIFSKEYEVFYNYPSRAFQFMIGASYSF